MVLASACGTPGGRATYITGGNDNTIALWDIRDADETMSHAVATAECTCISARAIGTTNRLQHIY